jgi:hypothetical protein
MKGITTIAALPNGAGQAARHQPEDQPTKRWWVFENGPCKHEIYGVPGDWENFEDYRRLWLEDGRCIEIAPATDRHVELRGLA